MISIPTATALTVEKDFAPPRRFLTPLSEVGHFLFVVDNSALDLWKRCPAAVRNYLLLGREAHAKNAALTFGGAVHAGLEALFLDKSDLEQVTAIMTYFTENPTPFDPWRTPANAVEILGHYQQRSTFPDYQWEILSDGHGLIVERAFEIPLKVIEVNAWVPIPAGLPMTVIGENCAHFGPAPDGCIFIEYVHAAWSGRIDVVCRIDDVAYVVDNKTTSYDGPDYIQSFYLSSQTCGYVWATRHLWPDFDITRFCLNAILFKEPGKNQRMTEKGPRGGKAPLDFYRAKYPYTTDRITEWYNDTVTHVCDLIHCFVRGHFPLNDSSCFNHKYHGVCGYYDACTIDEPEARAKFLMSERFKQVTWNPTHSR